MLQELFFTFQIDAPITGSTFNAHSELLLKSGGGEWMFLHGSPIYELGSLEFPNQIRGKEEGRWVLSVCNLQLEPQLFYLRL